MFNEMKKAIKEESPEIYDYQFGYDGPFTDYVNDIYGQAIDELCKQTGESINIEASIQCGRGRNDMYCESGRTYWDFECECDTLLEFAEEAETEEEFKASILAYLHGKWEDCEIEEDEDEDDDEDEEDEGIEDDEESE